MLVLVSFVSFDFFSSIEDLLSSSSLRATKSRKIFDVSSVSFVAQSMIRKQANIAKIKIQSKVSILSTLRCSENSSDEHNWDRGQIDEDP